MSHSSLPLTPLRAFEAAARLGSFSGAARELGITPSAVSQHMGVLEAELGVRLFERASTGVGLTEAGETLLPVMSEAFDRISSALAAFASGMATHKLRVTATPVFASFWLIPRLARLSDIAGRVDIALLPTLDYVDIAGGGADIGIRCGVPPWPGLRAELLLPITMTPVCAPRLVATNRPPLEEARDALDYPLLHADAGSHAKGEEWRLWLTAAGVEPPATFPGQSFRDPGLAFQAAISGLGLAIGYKELLRPALAEGRLVQPFTRQVRHPFSYYMVTPDSRSCDPGLAELRAWLMDEAASH